MRKAFLVSISALLIAIACSKSNGGSSGGGGGSNSNCTTAKSFSADVNPIIQSTCAAATCHNAGSINGPGPLINYQQVFDARSQIRAAVNSGTMPKNSSLTSTQKNNIICWIDAGAPNN